MAVTNNVLNSTNKSKWQPDVGSGEPDMWYLQLQANNGYKFRGDIKASYLSKDGTQKEITLEKRNIHNVWEYVYDCLETTDFVITGETSRDNELDVTANLTNCYADPPLPDSLQFGETEKPTLTWYGEYGHYQSMDLTVSPDKQTATGTKVLDADISNFAINVNADAFPLAVIGEKYGAINVYLVTLNELAEFSAKRFFKITGTDPETGTPIYENIDLGAYVNNIRRVYTNIDTSSTDVIRCGNYNTGVTCHQPSEDKITLDLGTAVVPAHNKDNTDYESEIKLFIPFAGFTNINNDYAGKTIALQYVINVVTGNGVALLSCDGVVFQVEETKPSSEILYLSPSAQVKTVGGDDWNEMLFYGVEPYIYCKWYESASEGINTDRRTGILGDFRGFNVFDDVTPIHTAEMLAEEQEMIYKALSNGVYIE